MPNTNSSLATYTTMMRVTTTGRPYTKDLHDLFAAFIIQQPLGDHRSFLRVYPSTFTTDEGVASMAEFKFTHVVRGPDPNDPSRQVSTRTTTTFSMSREMAKLLGMHFLNARLVENAVDPQNRTMKDKGIWSITPKGRYMIEDFSQRAQVKINHMKPHLARIESFQVFPFERLENTDQLTFSRPNMTQAFQTMMRWLPVESLQADEIGGLTKNDLHKLKYTFYGYQCFEWISEYTTVVNRDEALLIASEFVLYGWIEQILDKSDRANSTSNEDILFKMGRNTYYYVTERGQKVLGWTKDDITANVAAETRSNYTSRLLPTEADNSSVGVPEATVSRQQITTQSSNSSSTSSENMNTSTLLYDFGFANDFPMLSEKASRDDSTEKLLTAQLQPTVFERSLSSHSRTSVSQDSGSEVATAIASSTNSRPQSMDENGELKDSQWTRLQQILEDPLLRMYLREFMKAGFCEENIDFWTDYNELRKKLKTARDRNSKDILVDCYAIYESYLGRGAPSEVNIDHTLRQDIIQFVTSTFTVLSGVSKDIPFMSQAHTGHATVTVNIPASQCIIALMQLYDKVNDHICRIMAEDSVPRFMKTAKYHEISSTLRKSSDS
ncbi:hypothetical protein EC973_006785 [Apophysomyces ossiformis]|uniref:RGS domain-containing protein n=1 Tax=Apophysomyces ossiformis TaxID=679940 RepID=A0A8H7BQP7_9FUNG|nr:hypothetical protein EC973_006785 [Apophysomyces ossiformis]